METKKECEIVQDLLLSYNDDVLNPASKKMVVEHLQGCKACKEKLEIIQKEAESTPMKEQLMIQYWKKLRKKTMIKSVLLAIGIILVVLIGAFLRKFFIISNLIDKAMKIYESNNVYTESRNLVEDGKVGIFKNYYKDGKRKQISMVKTEDEEFWMDQIYTNAQTGETIRVINTERITTDSPIVLQKADDFEKKDIITLQPLYFYDGFFPKLALAWTMRLEKVRWDSQKEYYVLTEKRNVHNPQELWLDADTGLIFKDIVKNGRTSYMMGTDIVKDVRDNERIFLYQFGTVTEADVEVSEEIREQIQ